MLIAPIEVHFVASYIVAYPLLTLVYVRRVVQDLHKSPHRTQRWFHFHSADYKVRCGAGQR